MLDKKKLNKNNQLLTAFNILLKKYCFQRLPLGLSVSVEQFCKEMDQTMSSILGTVPCADDDKVQGSTEIRHDTRLLETVGKAEKAEIKIQFCKMRNQESQNWVRWVSLQKE